MTFGSVGTPPDIGVKMVFGAIAVVILVIIYLIILIKIAEYEKKHGVSF